MNRRQLFAGVAAALAARALPVQAVARTIKISIPAASIVDRVPLGIDPGFPITFRGVPIRIVDKLTDGERIII